MLKRLVAVLSLLPCAPAFAAPFLVGNVPDARANQCVFTRTTPVVSAVVVDAVNGLPANGNRVCKVDLAADPRTGTVTLALRDSVAGDTGPAASFTFPAPLPAPGNLRVVP